MSVCLWFCLHSYLLSFSRGLLFKVWCRRLYPVSENLKRTIIFQTIVCFRRALQQFKKGHLLFLNITIPSFKVEKKWLCQFGVKNLTGLADL